MKEYCEIKSEIQEKIELRKREREAKKQRIELYIKNNIENILNPVYVKYTKENSMSAADPSYIYPLICGGIRRPKLSVKKPKIVSKYDGYYEYGFDKEDHFLYCKVYRYDGTERLNSYYIYLDNVVYRISIINKVDMQTISSIEEYKKTDHFRYEILEEYHYGENHRLSKIVSSQYGYGIREEYQWLNDDVAIVKEGSNKYIMIKDKKDTLAVLSIENGNTRHQKFSYQTQGYIDLDHYTLRTTSHIDHSTLDIQYSLINDMNGKATEFYEMVLFHKKYIIFINYLKSPKSFSFKKAKEIYKQEIINYIENTIQELEFQVKMIGIQYGNYGYSIMDPFIGFDKGNNDDVQTMSYCIEYEFSFQNKEMISFLDDYIKVKGYYQSFRKLMKSIKSECEEKYGIFVLLDEIID